MLSDEYRYKLLRLLEKEPQLSQRELASQLGLSLGKVNYCVQSLIEKGLIKARNFRNSQNKMAYMYYLTPKGIQDKARVTVRFLQRKMTEYEQLKNEIEELRREAAGRGGRRGAGAMAGRGWRDILVRYKQTVMGIAWAVLRPLLAAVVFTVVFGKLANLPSDGVPYPLLVMVAVLPWQFFADGLAEAGTR